MQNPAVAAAARDFSQAIRAGGRDSEAYRLAAETWPDASPPCQLL